MHRKAGLFLLPLLALCSCGRGYDLSFGEALKQLNEINRQMVQDGATSITAGQYRVQDGGSYDSLDFSTEYMYFHRLQMDVSASEEGTETSLTETWFYVSEGLGYNLSIVGKPGEYTYSATLEEDLSASTATAKVRELSNPFYEKASSLTLQALSALSALETVEGADYSFFSREEGEMQGEYSLPLGSLTETYSIDFGAYFPRRIEHEVGETTLKANFAKGIYSREMPSNIELFPIPKLDGSN